jgi:hypothetical protein
VPHFIWDLCSSRSQRGDLSILSINEYSTCMNRRSNWKGEDFPSVLGFHDSRLKMTLAAGAMLGHVGYGEKELARENGLR